LTNVGQNPFLPNPVTPLITQLIGKTDEKNITQPLGKMIFAQPAFV
jgi:hypothetical protein